MKSFFYKIYKIALLILPPLLPFLCFFLGYLLSNLFIGNETIKTPNLIGMSLPQAIEQISPHHITIQLIGEKECSGMPSGTIINQKPSPDRLIKSHQSILVITTKQPLAQQAPNFITQNEDQINTIKKENHIKTKTYALPYQAPTGSCIAQHPQPGQTMNDQKMILYIAQEKPNQFIMPTIIGTPVTEAIQLLQQHDLTFSLLERGKKIPISDIQDKMVIINQKPIAGSLIPLQNQTHIQLEIANKTY